MIKVLHFCSDGNVGGAGKTLLRLASSYDSEKFELSVAIPRESKLKDCFSGLKVNVYPYSFKADSSFSLEYVFECCRIINEVKPHIVHTHGCAAARLSAYLCGVRSRIYTRHTYALANFSFLKGAVNDLITTKAVAVNPVILPQIYSSGIKKEKACLIYNGCEDHFLFSAKFLSENEKRMTALYHGRIVEEKGLDTAIKAVSILAQKNANVDLIILGEGKEKNHIVTLAKKLCIDSRVSFCPHTENVTDYINASDVIINCSRNAEGTSNSVIEGMSAARVAILSDIEGNKRTSNNGKCAMLYKRNDEHELARLLYRLYNDRSLYKDYSGRARCAYENRFTVKKMVDSYQRLWEEEHEKYYCK